jgi:hypothetical protein
MIGYYRYHARYIATTRKYNPSGQHPDILEPRIEHFVRLNGRPDRFHQNSFRVSRSTRLADPLIFSLVFFVYRLVYCRFDRCYRSPGMSPPRGQSATRDLQIQAAWK